MKYFWLLLQENILLKIKMEQQIVLPGDKSKSKNKQE